MINLESTNQFSEGYVLSKDNVTQIYYKKLKPENPIGNVVIIPGFGATATMFLGMQHRFYEAGYCSIILELRGHGFSDGKGGYVNLFNDFIDDLDSVINQVIEKNIPLYICGHSNGGLTTINYAIDYGNKLSGIILFSPWLGLSQPLNIFENAVKKAALYVYGKFSLPMGKRGADPTGCTTNPVWQKILGVDQQIHTWASANATYQAELAQAKVFANTTMFNVPTILIHAKNDPVASYNDSITWYNKISSVKKSLISLDKNIHHSFLEGDIIKQIYDQILIFINNGKI